MQKIIIKTQVELDALPASFEQYTQIIIQGGIPSDRIVVRAARNNSSVVAWGNSSVEAWGNSSVEARNNSSVEARNNSSVVAWDNSSVEARNNSSVVAYGNSSVEAYGNSSVEAYGNSSVEAWSNSSVEAWGNSSVVARDNSSVEAWGNSSVVASDNSSVEAWGNSSVEAWGNVGVRLQSNVASVALFMFSVCWILAKGKVEKKSKDATIIEPKVNTGNNGWLESQGLKNEKNTVVLFKKVSSNFKTQEGTSNETLWAIGQTLTHVAWAPDAAECGKGKFHACSRPYFCDEFRSNASDKYIAIKVNVKDLHAWSGARVSFPHKIAFRKGTVLYECDRYGKKV